MKQFKQFYTLLNDDHNKYTHQESIKKSSTLDFCRGLAVIFMIFVHVLGIYAHPKVYASSFGYVIDFLGSPPAAPVFMIIMGILFMLSSKNKTIKSGIKRSIFLFILAICFSFFRSDLLILPWASPMEYVALWEVDILQFAGLAYVFMTLIRHYIKKPIHWLYIAFVIMIVSPYLWGINTGIVSLDWLLHYLWGADSLVYFPLFPWLYYPLIGMIIGVLIKATRSEEMVIKELTPVGYTLLLIGSLISLTDLDFHIGDYFRSGQGSVIWITGFVLLWMALALKVTNLFKSSLILDTICYWGRQTPKIYIIHWLLISWSTLFIKESSHGYLMTINLMVVTLFLSHLLLRFTPKQT